MVIMSCLFFFILRTLERVLKIIPAICTPHKVKRIAGRKHFSDTL